MKIQIKKSLIDFYKLLFFTLIIFFIFDLLIGNYIYKKILRKNYFDVDTSMGIEHPVFHHGLKSNYKTYSAGWGSRKFSFCTDNNGFRSSCNKEENEKIFDIGFIGDSFTAGFGLFYEEMFVSKIKEKLKTKKIANLSSSSYAPSIYFAKINFLLDKGYKFNEIIVFVDLSDLQDDTVRYKLDENNTVKSKNIDWTPINYTKTEKLFQFLSRKLKVTHYLITNIDNFLIKKNIKKRKIPNWVLTTPRSSWTYKYNQKWYDNKNLDESISILYSNMNKLYDLLKKNNISLSIAVYPWPSTIFFDQNENLQVEIWRDYCLNKCKKFYNLMNPFFDEKYKIGATATYFKYFIEGDVHLNDLGNTILSENFLKIYEN